MVIDRIRSDELHAKKCEKVLETIIFKMESTMAAVPLTLNSPNLARIYILM